MRHLRKGGGGGRHHGSLSLIDACARYEAYSTSSGMAACVEEMNYNFGGAAFLSARTRMGRERVN